MRWQLQIQSWVEIPDCYGRGSIIKVEKGSRGGDLSRAMKILYAKRWKKSRVQKGVAFELRTKFYGIIVFHCFSIPHHIKNGQILWAAFLALFQSRNA